MDLIENNKEDTDEIKLLSYKTDIQETELKGVGLDYDELLFMNEGEQNEALEDAGLDSMDFDF